MLQSQYGRGFCRNLFEEEKGKKDKMDGLVIGMFLMAKQKSLKTK